MTAECEATERKELTKMSPPWPRGWSTAASIKWPLYILWLVIARLSRIKLTNNLLSVCLRPAGHLSLKRPRYLTDATFSVKLETTTRCNSDGERNRQWSQRSRQFKDAAAPLTAFTVAHSFFHTLLKTKSAKLVQLSTPRHDSMILLLSLTSKITLTSCDPADSHLLIWPAFSRCRGWKKPIIFSVTVSQV